MDELVKALRETDFGDTCVLCEHEDMCKGNDCIIIQAADAVEELRKRVPKVPHGRLIDADALMKLEVIPSENWVFRAIEKAPTIIEAEGGE